MSMPVFEAMLGVISVIRLLFCEYVMAVFLS